MHDLELLVKVFNLQNFVNNFKFKIIDDKTIQYVDIFFLNKDFDSLEFFHEYEKREYRRILNEILAQNKQQFIISDQELLKLFFEQFIDKLQELIDNKNCLLDCENLIQGNLYTIEKYHFNQIRNDDRSFNSVIEKAVINLQCADETNYSMTKYNIVSDIFSLIFIGNKRSSELNYRNEKYWFNDEFLSFFIYNNEIIKLFVKQRSNSKFFIKDDRIIIISNF